jgi:hypothetical protein
MTPVLAGAGISEHLTGQCGQPKHVVKLAIGEQSGIGRDHGATKLQHQTGIKIELNPHSPNNALNFRAACVIQI